MVDFPLLCWFTGILKLGVCRVTGATYQPLPVANLTDPWSFANQTLPTSMICVTSAPWDLNLPNLNGLKNLNQLITCQTKSSSATDDTIKGFENHHFSLRNTGRKKKHFWKMYLQSIGLVWLTRHHVFLKATDWHQKERPCGWATSNPAQSAQLNQTSASRKCHRQNHFEKGTIQLFMRLWRSNLLPFEPNKTNIGETRWNSSQLLRSQWLFLKNIVNHPES